MYIWYANGLLDIDSPPRKTFNLDIPVIICDYSHQAIWCTEIHSLYWAVDAGITMSNHLLSKIRTSPRFTLTYLGS